MSVRTYPGSNAPGLNTFGGKPNKIFEAVHAAARRGSVAELQERHHSLPARHATNAANTSATGLAAEMIH